MHDTIIKAKNKGANHCGYPYEKTANAVHDCLYSAEHCHCLSNSALHFLLVGPVLPVIFLARVSPWASGRKWSLRGSRLR